MIRAIADATCNACGGPLTYSTMDLPPYRGAMDICLQCVSLALCKMAVILHGDIGDQADSHVHEGHEERMAAHTQRIRTEMKRRGLTAGKEDTTEAEQLD